MLTRGRCLNVQSGGWGKRFRGGGGRPAHRGGPELPPLVPVAGVPPESRDRQRCLQMMPCVLGGNKSAPTDRNEPAIPPSEELIKHLL